jgi:hypothetical protein
MMVIKIHWTACVKGQPSDRTRQHRQAEMNGLEWFSILFVFYMLGHCDLVGQVHGDEQISPQPGKAS